MGTDLIVSNRAELTPYASLIASPRRRRIAVVAAVDILAVGLAFGALHITGAMMGSGSIPEIIPPVSAAEPATADTPLVPLPHAAPARIHLAAEPDAAVMFAAPVDVARGFTFEDQQRSSSTFTTTAQPAVATAEPESEPATAATPVPSPHLRPLARITAPLEPVIDAADGSIDRLLLRDAVPVGGRSEGVVSRVADTTVTEVASVAAPVASTTQGVTRAVTAPVQQVVGVVRGLLN
jgi:hypothetical protein